ncbi:aminotransferase class V-fold PLP-dependent enzyme [Marinobacterium arenosum]|uniref:aminotransferase class V-fold PLP-dependent enzyme n=1 Tax=Marinobacterium arenosum TaxID=2862496 RepID=UPI001C953988|nr:aminotransferase class V-fold PLP-dependent enzyme [Marinobacterium arenosum]MBY4675527.1 aminotransferase class V-fold PLP-dependent enzyme [Marinobacterium arenosum]
MSLSLETIRQAVIGEQVPLPTPFGIKPLIYADYTASGRGLRLIEEFISRRVLPYYANTHTETSFTGRQTTALREQAREQIRQALNGTPEHKVIFTGSGATAAIHKLIELLNLRLPAELERRYAFDRQIPEAERPVVFIGPYEHHSNELPWRESIATLVCIPLDGQGQLDLSALEAALQRYRDRPLKLGSFSAASNVTGIKTDVAAVTALLHRHNALAFWDYAAAGPYLKIDLQADGPDGLFLSPHKFIGGPGTPGVLVVREPVLSNRVPAVPGGGTVLYVTPDDHRFIEDVERREEGGTPGIIESIRAGLVFQLQQQVGTERIEAREHQLIQQALARWSAHPQIEILGSTEADRLSICSLQIRHRDKVLHYGFVVALLNDLFGIQARGGCSCAGPYGHQLLGMDMAYSRTLEARLLDGEMVLRPGWVRLNFNYFVDDATFEYLLRALELVAEHGWRLLPYYRFDPVHGVWRFQNQRPELPVDLADALQTPFAEPMAALHVDFDQLLAEAAAQMLQPRSQAQRYELTLTEQGDKLRWFVLPQEVSL